MGTSSVIQAEKKKKGRLVALEFRQGSSTAVKSKKDPPERRGRKGGQTKPIVLSEVFIPYHETPRGIHNGWDPLICIPAKSVRAQSHELGRGKHKKGPGLGRHWGATGQASVGEFLVSFRQSGSNGKDYKGRGLIADRGNRERGGKTFEVSYQQMKERIGC